MAYLFEVCPLFVIGISPDRLVLEAIPEIEQLDDVLGCLFEDYQAIDAPSIKP